MRCSTLAAGAFACLAAAAPSGLAPRAKFTDADILQYALTLEHLEDTFYREGLAKFSQAQFAAAGFDSTFYDNLKVVASDEKTHVAYLTAGLTKAGAKPVAACTYKFPYTDPKSFIALASVLEGVGVSAYLGAAADIMSGAYLTAAGSILTTEARHSSYVRASLDQVPFAQPFDNPLDFNEVYTLAMQFIKHCPKSNAKLPLKPFPVLTATASGTVKTGTTLSLKISGKAKKYSAVYGAFITVTGPIHVEVKHTGKGYSVVVPKGIAGQSYLVLTSSKGAVSDNNIIAGPAVVEIS